MEIGTGLPLRVVHDDPVALSTYARRIEGAGYEHVLVGDHVLGVDPNREDWGGPYDNSDPFPEVFTTLSYLAAETEELGFGTAILILPQRQTALVAKQAAQLDILSGGRLRLGVAVGWNPLEFVALGEDFSTRGRRIEEQVPLLRRLWSEEAVTFEGEFHEFRGVGINPRPERESVPLWMGGTAEAVKRRIARLGDGWIPQFQPGEEAEEELAELYGYVEDEGRDPDDVGINGRMRARPGEPDEWIERAQAWADLGADYLTVSGTGEELSDAADHAAHLETVAKTLSEADLL